MKKIILLIMAILIVPIAIADTGTIETYGVGEIFDLGIHLRNPLGEITGAECYTTIRYQNYTIKENFLMNELGKGYYNATYNTTDQGYYYCLQNCTINSAYTSETCDFIIEEETLSPEAIQISLLVVALIFAIILFIIGFYKGDYNFGFASGFLFSIIGIYILVNGFANLNINNFISRSMSLILIGIGGYILFRASIESMEEAENG